jgi:hypothetical protein
MTMRRNLMCVNLHDDEEELNVHTTLNGGNDMSSEKNWGCFKVNDPGSHCHESKDHEISIRNIR